MFRSRGIWEEKFERHAGRTFAEAASRWLKEYRGKDQRRPAIALESVFPYIGTLRLIDIDDEVMQPYKEDRLLGRGPFMDADGTPKPAMAGTVNKEISTVTAVLNKACRVWRWIPSAPLIERVSGATRVSYPLTYAEQDRLFRFLPNGWQMGAALFAVNTGVRRGELFGLKWEYMVPVPELNTFVFVLPGDTTKNGHTRAVICNSIAVKAVNYQRDNGSEYVFPSNCPGRRGLMCQDSSKVWSTAWKQAGLPMDPIIRKGIHNLRFSFATRLRSVGVPTEDRNALLGHANTDLATHYAMPDLERLLKWAELVTERRESVVLRPVRTA